MTRPAQPNFDRVARIYRWAEYATLGPVLQRVRTHLLPQLGQPSRALVLGDGDGRFLEQLLLRYPQCEALAVDSSAAMLLQLERRCNRSGAAARLRTLYASALTTDAPPGTDLVVTNFFLDCLSQQQVDGLTRRLSAQLQPGSLWLVSDFALPPSRFLRPLARLYIAGLYVAFRVLTGLRVDALPEPAASFQAGRFRRLTRRSFLGGLLYTELWRRE